MLLAVLTLVISPAAAEERLALVVGNSSYASVSSLENPANDARLMAQSLADLGFRVTLLVDSPRAEMMQGIRQFGRDLRNAGTDATGLFYFAGHGVQSFGTNYLIPTDISVSDPADLDLVAIEAQSVLRQMFSARNRTNIVILDACRNNPFSDIPDFNDNGLAEMQAPTGTFLSYATAPGGVALDGLDGNSPFTKAVARHINTPGLKVEQLFKQVRVDVIAETSGQQTPWDASSLTTDFVFSQKPTLSARDLEAQTLWNSVKDSGDTVQIMLFLRAYGDSIFAPEAKTVLSTLLNEELSATAAPDAAPKPARPSASEAAEQQMFSAAQSDASVSGFQSYLDAYPNGIFSEIAKQEILALQNGNSQDPIGEGVTPDPNRAEAALAPVAPLPGTPTLTFDTPLVSEDPEINGRSIAELISATPFYPPVEGLPESYWKGQVCSNCHQWTQERICEQATTYVQANRQRSLEKPHPFGGPFKQNLRIWAEAGCQ
jgi:uncharacterized caspase-like protein